jgi:hypothetical protein
LCSKFAAFKENFSRRSCRREIDSSSLKKTVKETVNTEMKRGAMRQGNSQARTDCFCLFVNLHQQAIEITRESEEFQSQEYFAIILCLFLTIFTFFSSRHVNKSLLSDCVGLFHDSQASDAPGV